MLLFNSVGRSYLVTRFMLFIPHKARTMKEGRFKGKGLVENIDLAELTDESHFPRLLSTCLSESR